MQALNMHIGHNHNKEVLALRNQKQDGKSMQEEKKWKKKCQIKIMINIANKCNKFWLWNSIMLYIMIVANVNI